MSQVEYALRRAVEESPYDREAWLERARLAEELLDGATQIASLIGAVEADPGNLELLREVAFQLCKYVNARKYEIPKERRGVYLASVRAHMERVAEQLDATGLSRLAWLFLLEGDEVRAKVHARAGLTKDPRNEYCLGILQKLNGR